jgi:DnaJ-class molecular chaperone
MTTNTLKFNQVAEAFDVLYNIETKAIYDEYGEFGLKEGVTRPDGTKIGGGYFLKKDPEQYFEEVLQATNFVASKRENDGSDA